MCCGNGNYLHSYILESVLHYRRNVVTELDVIKGYGRWMYAPKTLSLFVMKRLLVAELARQMPRNANSTIKLRLSCHAKR